MLIYITMFWYEAIICCIINKNGGFVNKTFVRDKSIVKIRYKNIVYLLLVMLPLWFVMGFRDGIGADFNSYKIIYKYIKDTGLNAYGMEKGYWYLNVLIGKFANNEQVIFVVTAFMIVFLYLKGMINSSKQILIPLMTFIGMGYYFYSMNILRQYIAIAIVFSCFHYYEEEKIAKFVTAIIIASSFHASVLIWIPIIILVQLFKGKKFYFITFIMAFLSRIFIQYFLKFIVKYTSYGNYFLSDNNFIQGRMSIWNVLVSGGTLLVAFMLRDKLYRINKNNEKRAKFVWIMLLEYTIFDIWGDAVIRTALSFSFVLLILINDMFQCFEKKTSIFLKMIYIVFLFVIMLVIVNYGGNYVPYDADMVIGEFFTEKKEQEKFEIWDKKRCLEHFFRVRGEKDTHSVCGRIYKRELFKDLSFIEGRMNEDVLACYQIACSCQKVVYSTKQVYHYRNNDEGVTRSLFSKKKMDLLYVWEKVHNLVEQNNPEFLELCEINEARARFTLLSQMYINGFNKKDEEMKKIKQKLKGYVRKQYWKLMKWKMPVSRKILLTILII